MLKTLRKIITNPERNPHTSSATIFRRTLPSLEHIIQNRLRYQCTGLLENIKKCRRKDSDDVFPNVMTNGHTQFKSKQSIKEAIGQCFSDVSLNKDTEATLFKTQFPSTQEQQPKPVTLKPNITTRFNY